MENQTNNKIKFSDKSLKEKAKEGGRITLKVGKRFKKTVICALIIISVTILGVTGVIDLAGILEILNLTL